VTRKLPTDLSGAAVSSQRIRLPMLPDSRRLNLSNTLAAVICEA
jgi:tRNA(Leu) C34 or U34 (ribose-2'-O)-methylase TrmL